jgi:excisionase family DNA binding protein
MLTLGQAAKQTGVSKTAISRAIKNGRLSATRSESGDYQIDPAELVRVYPVTVNRNTQAEQMATQQDAHMLHGQIETLRELVEQIKGERDDLRRRLDAESKAREQAAEDVRRLTYLLAPPAPTPPPYAPASPAQASPKSWNARPWFVAALVLACLGVAVALLLAHP